MEILLQGYGDFSRRPTDGLDYFDVQTPIQSALVILERRAKKADVQLVVALQPMMVRGSMLAIQQAVVNLAQNAIDAVQGLPNATVWIRVQAGTPATVEIQDNGPGLPEQIQRHLFEPFHTTKQQGTGLGLKLSHDLLRASEVSLMLMEYTQGTCWKLTFQG